MLQARPRLGQTRVTLTARTEHVEQPFPISPKSRFDSPNTDETLLNFGEVELELPASYVEYVPRQVDMDCRSIRGQFIEIIVSYHDAE